jgi:hypothetical protein
VTHRGDYYLLLPDLAEFGGLRWSHGGDAIEDRTGRTVVLVEELEHILAGVFAGSSPPPFTSVLQILHHARCDTGFAHRFAPLRYAWRRVRGSESAARHLGLLIAELCGPFAPAVNPPTWVEVQLGLARLRADGERRRPEYALVPALAADEFAGRVGELLEAFTPDALDHWLKYGGPPTDAGEKLADEVADLPRSVAAVLALARGRPRLAGAAVLAPALDAALTLPPRGRTPDPLPQGGYADVSTRGDPDRLLLSQFALDPDEFVRRFAERELLYFKREEPHAATPPERVIVLDQGVRTWGGVRLALAAAALTLLKQPVKAAPPPRLFSTSRDTEVSLPPPKPEALASVLEASDLTRHPADVVAKALNSVGATSRDVVLLTHPRAATEPDVQAAARDRRPTDRLFVLAVDDDGVAELSEWAARGPVHVRSFRVDLAAAEAAKPVTDPPPSTPVGRRFDYRPWAGDVEAVPFPFRPGLVEPPMLLGFDARGEWLAVVTQSGFVHALGADGGSAEVLPRAVLGRAVLKSVSAVLPVEGGVVVCGKMMAGGQVVDVPAAAAVTITSGPIASADTAVYTTLCEHHVAAHYDFASRTVRAYVIGPATGTAEWETHLDLYCVVLRSGASGCPLAVDLVNMNRLRPTEPTLRVEEALRHARWSAAGPKQLEVVTDLRTVGSDKPVLALRGNSFTVIQPGAGQWPWFEPTEDGKPLLGGTVINCAVSAGHVLALSTNRQNRRELRLFRGPDPVALGVVPLVGKRRLFTLSPDGGRVAWTHGRDVAVARTDHSTATESTAAHAALHNQFDVYCGSRPLRLTIGVGQFTHEFWIEGGELRHQLVRDGRRPAGNMKHFPLPDGFDPARFDAWAEGADARLRVVTDDLGQVILCSRDGEPLAAFLIRRELAAAWSAEGGFWGDPQLIGGPPTPNAARGIAAVILRHTGDWP